MNNPRRETGENRREEPFLGGRVGSFTPTFRRVVLTPYRLIQLEAMGGGVRFVRWFVEQVVDFEFVATFGPEGNREDAPGLDAFGIGGRVVAGSSGGGGGDIFGRREVIRGGC